MAHIDMNTRIIDNINNDNIAAALNYMIDSELSKDVSQMNTALIDECVNALLELESDKDNNFALMIPIISSKEYLKMIQPKKAINWKDINVCTRAALIAALLASTTLTVNAAYEVITGNKLLDDVSNSLHSKLVDWGLIDDEMSEILPIDTPHIKEEPTTVQEAATDDSEEVKTVRLKKPVASKNIEQFNGVDDDNEETTTHHYIEQFNGDDDDDEETTTKPAIEQFNGEDDDDEETTTRRKPEPTTVTPAAEPTTHSDEEAVLISLEADYDDSFKLDYVYGEALSYDGLTLTANYSDGSRKNVDIKDTNHTESVNMNVTADYTLRIIYKTCVVTIDITVRPDDDTRGAQVCENELYDYMLTKKGVYITKYKGDETNIDIDKLDGEPVFAIGAGVYSGKNIEHVTAENAQKIFANAFKDCVNLETCYTPRAKYIGNSAFENDVKLKHPVFSNDLSYLGTAVYKNSGITEISLTENISEVPDELCENCADLASVNLLGAEAVGKYAFSECTSLVQVSGTDVLTKAGDFAFYNCKSAEFTEKPSKLTAAGDNAFAYCNNIDFGKLYITEVAPYGFLYCHKLTNVEIDGRVSVIPEGAFRGCHIDTLKLNEGVSVIDDTAFMSINITEVHLPSTLDKIGTYGLYSTRLRDLYCPRALNSIGSSAFYKTRLTMHVYKNSYAHTYAYENNIKYVIIEDGHEIVQLQGEDDVDDETPGGIINLNGEDD